ncbi:hypothetical protein AM593_09781, partial [Mytilus galloprovincialis]
MPIHEDADDDDRPILENADNEFDNDNGSPGIPDMQIEDINNISFDPNTSFSYIKDDDSVVQNQNTEEDTIWVQYYEKRHANWTLQDNKFTVQISDISKKLPPPD